MADGQEPRGENQPGGRQEDRGAVDNTDARERKPKNANRGRCPLKISRSFAIYRRTSGSLLRSRPTVPAAAGRTTRRLRPRRGRRAVQNQNPNQNRQPQSGSSGTPESGASRPRPRRDRRIRDHRILRLTPRSNRAMRLPTSLEAGCPTRPLRIPRLVRTTRTIRKARKAADPTWFRARGTNQQKAGTPSQGPNQQKAGTPSEGPNQQKAGTPNQGPNQQKAGTPSEGPNQQKAGTPSEGPNQQKAGTPSEGPNQQKAGTPSEGA